VTEVTLVSKTYWIGMPFWFRTAPEAAVESLVLRAHDMRQLRALWWHRGTPNVGIVVIHPRVDFAHHYAIPRLVEAGFGVLAATARHGGNDTLTEYEEIVLDVAACVRWLREKRGVARVVLLGNCGGGSLVAYYQSQARRPAAERITRTPAGSPTYFEGATMLPADGLVYVAPHPGLGKLMQCAIDPSVTDEHDPLSVDPELDMYDARNGFQPAPAWSEYDAAFLARYRAAQRARVARLDTHARERIASRHGSERAKVCEEIMVVYRTMANPAFVDRRIDPSGRDYGSLLSERPDLMNYAALGMGRTMTPRVWLSTWSGLASNADLVSNVARIAEPTLLVAAGRDREIYPADIEAIAGAIASADKRVETIPEARHYFEPEPGRHDGHVAEVMDRIVPWIAERFG
jgi:dienelactone hydrolase